MPWCPECKAEYVEGMKVCADCGCELVERLEEETEELPQPGPFMEDWVAEEEPASFFDEEEPKKPYKGRYRSLKERAEENRASAYVLLLVGSAGLILMILFFLDVLPLPQLVANKYLISGVMEILFIFFIIMGAISLRNFKKYEKDADEENNLTAEIRRWCAENLNRDEVDAVLDIQEDMQEELKYFSRMTEVKNRITAQFINLDEAYLDRVADEIYPEIFEEIPS